MAHHAAEAEIVDTGSLTRRWIMYILGIYILTFGGPGTSTGTSSFLIWRTTLRQFDVGSGAAMTLLFALAVTVITLPVVKYYTHLARHEDR